MKKQSGLTILELLIVAVIIAVLASIAIPTYNEQVIKARRSDGLVALLDLATRMERYFAENHTYAGASLGSGGTLSSTNESPEGYYTLSISNLTATTFTLTATPVGSQVNDTKCGALSINELGQKSISGSSTLTQCWR